MKQFSLLKRGTVGGCRIEWLCLCYARSLQYFQVEYSKASGTPDFPVKGEILVQSFQTMQLEMAPSVNAIFVFLLFRLVSTFSLPSRDLVLENLPNSTNLYRPSSQSSPNRTAVKLGDEEGTLTCLSGLRSPPLDPRSCQNAWEKIPLFGEEGEELIFRHRHERPPPAQP